MKHISHFKRAERYDAESPQGDYLSHQRGFSRRIAALREAQLIRKALQIAGQPREVLDIPCGMGRLWPILAENPDRRIIGADDALHMLDAAERLQPDHIRGSIRLLHTSARDVALPAQAVDAVICMRLFHYLGDAQSRMDVLKEFARVSRNRVILSLWVSSRFMALRRQRTDRFRLARNGAVQPEYQGRYVIPAKVAEAEFREAGFNKIVAFDYLPFCGLSRIYLLQK
ncbi:class I SAM-dependent methyltransferase [Pseudomonas sp. NPDC089401]|uniref:class I SAM-dependent methyltransferase n=1 Tax=Pseudomonas sp. NPDC089401 TaxID=3364462 RepID=UPI003829C859